MLNACEAKCHYQTVSSTMLVTEKKTLGLNFPFHRRRLMTKL
jgi:hypothetical protein